MPECEAQVRAALAAIVETSNDAILSCSPGGMVLSWNAAAERMFGYSAAEVLGRGVALIAPPDRQHEIHHHAWLLRHGKTVPPFETVRVARDGHLVDVQMSLSAIPGASGKITQIAYILRDITASKRAEDAAREDQRRLATLMENLRGMAYRCRNDPQWTMEFVSMGCRELTGYAPEDLLQNRKLAYADITLAEDRQQVWDQIQRGIEAKTRFTLEYRITTAGGGVKWVWEQGCGVFGADGELLALEGLVIDITQRKRAEEERERLAAIVEFSQDAIISTDPDRIIVSWNASAARLYGYTAAEAIGMNIQTLAPPELLQESNRNRELINQGVQVVPHETVRLAKDGRRIDVLVTASPVRDSAGNIVGSSSIHRDVGERKQTEAMHAQLAAIVEFSQDAIVSTNRDRVIMTWNAGAEQLYGYTAAEAVGRHIQFLTPPELQQERERYLGLISQGMQVRSHQTVRLTKEGRRIHVLRTLSPVRDSSGNVIGISAISRDIGEHRQTEAMRAQLAAIVENSNDAIIGRSLDGAVTSWNAGAERLLGYSASEAIGRPIAFVLPPGQHNHTSRFSETVLRGDAIASHETRRLTKDGRVIEVMSSISPLRDSTGKVIGASHILHDITALKQAAQRIEFLAQYDTVTGLPNRRLLTDRLTLALARDKRLGAMTALLLVDLDRFKLINETLGHSTGDEALRMVTARLRECLREVDTIARLGGDEFVVILESAAESAQALRVAEKIMAALAEPLLLAGEEAFVTASIGIALYPADAEEVDKLLECAELAMYQAKQEGRNMAQFYVAERGSSRGASLGMQSRLRRAIERDELLLHYQPKVDIRSGAITSAEALIRWRNPDLGLVSPAAFIPLAEETGLIVPIGEWVLHSASMQASAWHRQGYPLAVAVNLSARQFRQNDLCEMVERALADSALDARWLELEITESMIMHRPEQVIATLQRLRELGVKLSVDDFGTGYSSLSYLKRFPVDKLKIDQSFVRELHQNADDAAIVRAVIALAASLNLKTIAEGVETEQQLIYLAGLQCDEYQGYYFSKPLPPAEFLQLLQARSSAAPPTPIRDPV